MINAILRFFAFIILIFFVIALPLSLVLRDVGALIFDPETTKTLVRDNLLNSEMIASLARQTTEQMLGGEVESQVTAETAAQGQLIQRALAELSGEDWQRITELAVPENLIEQSLNEVVDAYTSWLNSDQPFPDAQLNLQSWKENTAAHAADVMKVILDALPECTAEEAAYLALQGLQSGDLAAAIPLCRPPEPIYGTLVANAKVLLGGMLINAPDVIDLNQFTQGQEAPPELVQLKTNLTSARAVLAWTWVAVAGLGALAVAMAARSLKSVLKWSGWPLLLAGTATLVIGLGLRFFSLRFLDEMLANAFSSGSGALGSAGGAIASGALDLISAPLLLQGLFLTTLGAVALMYVTRITRGENSPGIPINRKRIGL